MFIDESIELDVTTLPKILQNIIKDCELYNNEEGEIMYDGAAASIDVHAKHLYSEGVITQSQREILYRKYCKGVRT